MVLKSFTDAEILANLKILVSKERRLLSEVLYHLLEVYRRKLHLELAYSSLHEYCVKELAYPNDQAYRRIAAMRVLSDCPEISASIEEGSINLTHLSQAGNYFNSKAKARAPLSIQEKREVLQKLQEKPTRETEKFFAELMPEEDRREKLRSITEHLSEVRFVASDALLKKLEEFKALDSHSLKNGTYAEVFERFGGSCACPKAKCMSR